MDVRREPWDIIDLANWASLPVIVGRLATEQDVEEGRAVFYLGDGSTACPRPVFLPKCAWLIEGHKRVAVVVIQVEESEGKTYVGYRDLVGGNGVCAWEEIETIDAPDALFFMDAAHGLES